MKRILFLCLLCVHCSIVASVTAAEQPSKKPTPVKSHDKSDDLGWNFYWEIDEVEEEKKEKPLTPQPQAASQEKKSKPLSTKWFKENFSKIQQIAIDNPSKKNIRAVLYMERVMLDKGEVYARKKRYYQSTIAELQEGVRLPSTTLSAGAFKAFKAKQRKEAMKEISKKAGLALFYDHNCAQCSSMVMAVNRLHKIEKQHVIVIAKNLNGQKIPKLAKGIEVIKDNGHSQRFNIKVWPALALMQPPLDVLILSQGATYYTELERRMINIAFENKILDEEWFYRLYPEEKGLLSIEQITDLPKDAVNDPVALINYIADIAKNPEGSGLKQTEEDDSHE